MKSYNQPMHTAEHILNQAMVRKFQCNRSFSNHIEAKKSKCDYHFPRSLTQVEEAEIEHEVNNIISQNLTVTATMLTRNEAVEKFNLDRLPENSGDLVRIISVGEYDTCPCIGVHVENTSEIGLFKLISTSFENDVLRIRYKLIQS